LIQVVLIYLEDKKANVNKTDLVFAFRAGTYKRSAVQFFMCYAIAVVNALSAAASVRKNDWLQ